MKDRDVANPEQSLDPQDWDAMRKLGQQMVEDMLTWLETVRDRPLWKPVPESVKAFLNQPVPAKPEDPEQVYREFLEYVLPYPMGNVHPRFWGWVIGTGTPFGVLADMLAATMNPNVGGGDHVAPYVEAQVLNWCKEILGYPREASGLLTSGGSAANLIGLAVARNAKAGFDVRRQGLSSATRRLILYGSQEMHSSIQKDVELLGLGSDSIRQVPVDSEFQIDLKALRAAIAKDKRDGNQPFCVVGNAGTTNTGAIDDLDALADVCAEEGLWFHVDGAVGAFAALSPELRPLVKGMERADSLAFDLHKWIYMPYDIGCALVRNEPEHRRAFSLTPDYLKHAERGLAAGSLWFSDYGYELSRPFRALKAWMSLKEHGSEKYGRMVRKNVEQARYLAELVRASPELELAAPAPLNIVCFRYVGHSHTSVDLDALNQELLIRLYESGIAAPSYTQVDGKYVLRVANTNQRSRREDFDLLVREVIRFGKDLEPQYESREQ